MKLKKLIPLTGNCHLTIWKRDCKYRMRVVARGFSRNEKAFADVGDCEVTSIRASYNGTLSIIVE